MDEEKKRKLLLILMPIAAVGMAIFMAYAIFFDGKGEEQVVETNPEYNIDIGSAKKEEQKSKLELYRQQRGRNSGDKKQVNSSDFYALSESKEESFESEEEDESDIPPSQRSNTSTASMYDVEEAPKKEPTKQKQKVVYREKIVYKESKSVQQQPVVIEQPIVKQTRSRSRGNSLGSLAYGETSSTQNTGNLIYCYVDNDNKKVKSGDNVNLVVSQDCKINGFSVTAGTKIIGLATISGDRVRIKITQIYVKGSYTSVDYAVYETDGTSGIKIKIDNKQAIKEEVANGATGGNGASINIPAIGTISTKSLTTSRSGGSVVLLDRHRVFLK
jgi:hypothetical protein